MVNPLCRDAEVRRDAGFDSFKDSRNGNPLRFLVENLKDRVV